MQRVLETTTNSMENTMPQITRKISCTQLFLCHNRPFQAFKSIKSFLQKINCQITDQDVDKVLKEWQDLKALTYSKIWKNRNASDVDSDEDYGEHIANVGTILHSVWHASKHNCVIENVFSVRLHAGKPNLILFQNKPLLSEVLVLFELQQYIPRAEHILICNKNTTEEEVICLIFRAITNDKRIKMAITTKMDWNSAKPLYCLVYPEKLALSTLKQVCDVVQDLLLNSVQVEKLKHCLYTFVVMSCDSDNSLCKILEPFELSLSNKSFQTLPNQLLSQLYRNLWTNNQKHDIGTKPPWIQLYTSEQVAMGKSTLIQRDIQRIREIHRAKTVHKICVAFNNYE
ncbi:hypothetical protein RFI_36972 [Reticulomyxa filosa]|uniref:Uncharacterized protein n=1 Tax=Reticulomyxa filosa TaxID=46433 RepID=X6LH84_RETFI|nr:hypothetical protein RFI_36972 [Reticulomyxa filosa]|eukprot:ETO00472.1 hypothetical protein RFI_36972 [Reticulomyxa filosa]